MSLIEDLGANYCNDMMVGSGLMIGNKTYILHQVSGLEAEEPLHLRELRPDGEFSSNVRMPASAISSWSDLRFPTLGYRQDMDGGWLGYLQRRPSTRRGLHSNDVRVTIHDSSASLNHALRNSPSTVHGPFMKKWGCLPGDIATLPYRKIWHAFNPRFTPFTTGIKELLSLDTPAFALSAEFAIAAAAEENGFEVLYRQRRIGFMNPDGKISLNINSKLINELWEQETSRG